MQTVPRPSHTPLPVMIANDTPIRARNRPISAAKSSSRITGSSGAFDRRMNCTQPTPCRMWLASLIAVRNEKLSIAMAPSSTAIGSQGTVSGSGCWILWMPSYSENRPPSENRMIETRNA